MLVVARFWTKIAQTRKRKRDRGSTWQCFALNVKILNIEKGASVPHSSGFQSPPEFRKGPSGDVGLDAGGWGWKQSWDERHALRDKQRAESGRGGVGGEVDRCGRWKNKKKHHHKKNDKKKERHNFPNVFTDWLCVLFFKCDLTQASV